MKLLAFLSRLSLLTKMIILICSLIIVITLTIGFYIQTEYTNTIKEQAGIRALDLAETVAAIPTVIEGLQKDNPSAIIQPMVEDIRNRTGAKFIVVGNREGIRFSHPLKDRIGYPMVGDDNERALQFGEAYVSEATGSLGPSIRGKAPIFNTNGEIIGIVSVGILVDDVDITIGSYVKEIWLILSLCLLVGVIGALSISLHVKKAIWGLEPKEIGLLFKEREAMLQSIHEAMIAIDNQGKVTMYNHAAEEVLHHPKENIIGKLIKDLFPSSSITAVLETGTSQLHQEIWIENEHFIVTSVPIFDGNNLIGAVSTFRNVTEIENLAKELSKVKEYSDALRVQTHEFTNKLNTISGFLQLGKLSEAISFINKETEKQQEWIHFFINNVSDPYISALLLGKLNRAHELGIDVTVAPDSKITGSLSEQQREAFITILGNLLENASDSVLEHGGKREVHIFFSDEEDEVIFEIEDSGNGIHPDYLSDIYSKGFSTKKGDHRGIGLSLVKKLVEELDGQITVDDSGLGGACFIVAIPKQRGAED